MPELAVPLLILGLIGFLLIRRGLIPRSVGTGLAWLMGLGLGVYVVLDVLPWIGGEATGSLRVEVHPAGAVGLSADGTPVPIRVRVYGGPVLVREEVIAPATSVASMTAQPLRIERIEGTSAVRVLRGEMVLGELSAEAVADLRATPEVPVPTVFLEAEAGPVLPILGTDRELRQAPDPELVDAEATDLAPAAVSARLPDLGPDAADYEEAVLPRADDDPEDPWSQIEALEREAERGDAREPSSAPRPRAGAERGRRYEARDEYPSRGDSGRDTAYERGAGGRDARDATGSQRSDYDREEIEPEAGRDAPPVDELPLRSRAMSLAVESPCRAASLLADAKEQRSRALAEDLRARCKRTLR